MKVVYSPRAERHLDHIYTTIAADNPDAALRVVQQVEDMAVLLASHPKLGRVYDGQVRRLNMPRYPYSVFYRIDAAQDRLIILAILHGRRLPPKL